jgi:hypothetical protein
MSSATFLLTPRTRNVEVLALAVPVNVGGAWDVKSSISLADALVLPSHRPTTGVDVR